MKIGVLTLPLHTNYGGILQAYALQTVLEHMGYDCLVIQRLYRKRIIRWKYPLQIIKRCIIRFVLGKRIELFPEIIWNKNQQIIERNTQGFINNHICTYQIKEISNIKENDFDVIIVGSDQIWRPKYFRLHYKYIQDAFLSFAEKWDVKRIAYAPSFGTDEWEYNEAETLECGALLHKFDAISIREQSGIGLCEKYWGCKKVKWVLDPTMLLDKEDYEIFIPQNIKAPGDLMCYVLDDNSEISNLIQKLVDEGSYKAFYANSRVGDASLPANERIQPPIEQWLVGFRDAKLVITDSFHACVFSILFHKPFIVIGNRKRGFSRFESLLKLFGLESRLIEDETQFDDFMLSPLSDDVYKRLEVYRKSSMLFLNKALTD